MKTMMALFLMLAAAVSVAAGEATDYPMRDKYKHIKTVELKDLHAKYGKVVIVDVRSRYEYTTLHIKDALNIPLNGNEFIEKVKKVREATSDPIVFYCNGKDCVKSYEAAEKAKNNYVANVYAYDAGIFDWAKTYPDKTVLLGKSPIDPAELLSKDTLNQHMLLPDEFDRRTYTDDVIIVDVRDMVTSRATPLYPLKQRYVPLDNEQLRSVVDEARQKGKTLMFYDNVGKQLQWLQYYLEREKVQSYYFLKGGADGYLDIEVARLLKKPGINVN